MQLRRAVDRVVTNRAIDSGRRRRSKRTLATRPESGGHAVDTTGATVALDELPVELRSRVMAATAHARYRHLERRVGGAGHEFVVYAVAGDRVVHMELSQRADGSVAEATETFLRDQILTIDIDGEHASVEVDDPTGRRSIPIPPGLATVLQDE